MTVARFNLEAFFRDLVGNPAWEAGWKQAIVFAASDRGRAETYWNDFVAAADCKMSAEKATEECKLETRKGLLLARLVFDAYVQRIAFVSVQEGHHSGYCKGILESEHPYFQNVIACTAPASGGSQWLLVEEMAGLRLAILRKTGRGGKFSRLIAMTGTPTELWAFMAYKYVEFGSEFCGHSLNAGCLGYLNRDAAVGQPAVSVSGT